MLQPFLDNQVGNNTCALSLHITFQDSGQEFAFGSPVYMVQSRQNINVSFVCSSMYKVGQKNQQDPTKEPLSKEKCVQFVKDIFISAAERDIHTGDGVVINVITKDGTTEELFPLRKD